MDMKYILISICTLGFISILINESNAQSIPEGLFVFEADERLFAAHAFMNVGGYDIEYNKNGMHPIRAEIRALLDKSLSKTYQDSVKEFYQNHDHYLGYYGTYAFALTAPPHLSLEFNSTTSSAWAKDEIEALSNLDDYLKEFYDKAEIGKLWQQYRPRIQELHDRFRPHATAAVQHLESFFREKEILSEGQNRKIITAFSPLLSYFQAFTVTVNGNVYLVFGPQPNEPSPASYYHEAGHYFVDPVVEKYRSETDRLEPLFRLAQEKQGIIGYAFVEESLVRTVDILLSGKLFDSSDDKRKARIEDEYKLGFILCPYFFEALPAYVKSNKTFEEYFPTLIAGITLAKERNRWNEFWEGQGRQ